jgi:hypothetical protein
MYKETLLSSLDVSTKQFAIWIKLQAEQEVALADK